MNSANRLSSQQGREVNCREPRTGECMARGPCMQPVGARSRATGVARSPRPVGRGSARAAGRDNDSSRATPVAQERAPTGANPPSAATRRMDRQLPARKTAHPISSTPRSLQCESGFLRLACIVHKSLEIFERCRLFASALA
jgi:hypothetical protein